jgi:gamma-glutamylcyclotransferase (GGCT)/AIG2-like uncharacterized protein YtfP
MTVITLAMPAVAGRDFQRRKASLLDYALFKLKGESYPGIIYHKGAFTNGIIYLDVDALSLKRLDEFEGEMYERVSVRVETDQGESFTGETYGIKREHRNLLSSEPWDLEEFEKNHLKEFMASYKGFSLRPSPLP